MEKTYVNDEIENNELFEDDPFKDFFESWDEDEYYNLDELVESDEFKENIKSLKFVPDMKFNLDYLADLHSDDSSEEDKSKAIDCLVEANDKLVKKIVSKYAKLATVSYDESDMYQEGMKGLIKAAEKFDASKDCQFSTYAVWWIRQHIYRGYADLSRTVRIPVHMCEAVNKYKQFQKSFKASNGREANVKEASIALNVSEFTIENMIDAGIVSRLSSLDAPVGEDQNSSVIEFIEDYRYKTPEQSAYEGALTEEIDRIIESCLKPKEQKIIILRYGLHGETPHTLEEVGLEYKVTRERIRQIEAKALRKLSTVKNKERLKDFIYA